MALLVYMPLPVCLCVVGVWLHMSVPITVLSCFSLEAASG